MGAPERMSSEFVDDDITSKRAGAAVQASTTMIATVRGSAKIPFGFFDFVAWSQRFPAAGANVRHQTRSRPDGLHF